MAETWVCHDKPVSKRQSMECKYGHSSKGKVSAAVVSQKGNEKLQRKSPSQLISLKKVQF